MGSPAPSTPGSSLGTGSPVASSMNGTATNGMTPSDGGAWGETTTTASGPSGTPPASGPWNTTTGSWTSPIGSGAGTVISPPTTFPTPFSPSATIGTGLSAPWNNTAGTVLSSGGLTGSGGWSSGATPTGSTPVSIQSTASHNGTSIHGGGGTPSSDIAGNSTQPVSQPPWGTDRPWQTGPGSLSLTESGSWNSTTGSAASSGIASGSGMTGSISTFQGSSPITGTSARPSQLSDSWNSTGTPAGLKPSRGISNSELRVMEFNMELGYEHPRNVSAYKLYPLRAVSHSEHRIYRHLITDPVRIWLLEWQYGHRDSFRSHRSNWHLVTHAFGVGAIEHHYKESEHGISET
ncbi:unnamed protein product, partial [Clonostachys rhizophaga]